MTEPPDQPPNQEPPWRKPLYRPGQMPPPPPERVRIPRRESDDVPSVAMAFVGMFLTIPISFFVVVATYEGAGLAPGATAAALVLALGGGLCFVRESAARGLGIGLMIGWAGLTIISGGICTGLHGLVE